MWVKQQTLIIIISMSVLAEFKEFTLFAHTSMNEAIRAGGASRASRS